MKPSYNDGNSEGSALDLSGKDLQEPRYLMLADSRCETLEALCCMQAQRKEFNAQEPRYETSKPPYPSGQLSFHRSLWFYVASW